MNSEHFMNVLVFRYNLNSKLLVYLNFKIIKDVFHIYFKILFDLFKIFNITTVKYAYILLDILFSAFLHTPGS